MIFIHFSGKKEEKKLMVGKKTKYFKENGLYSNSFYFNIRDGC